MHRNFKRILVYRCGALGDTLVALPAINALKKRYPASRLYLMTQSNRDSTVWPDAILKDFPAVDGFITYTAAAIRTLQGILKVISGVRSFDPDLIIYLPNDKNTGLRQLRDRMFFTLASKALFLRPVSKKAGFSGFSRTRKNKYPKETNRLLTALTALGIAGTDVNYELPLGASTATVDAFVEHSGFLPTQRLVAICPGSKMPAKRWSIERYAEIGKRLITNWDAAIMIVGGREDQDSGRFLQSRWPKGKSALAAGNLDIMASAELLRRSLFYLGNDTGAMHLAAAAGTPCIALFSSRDFPESWYPWGDGHICLRKTVPCEGCLKESCDSMICINSITVEEVAAACDEMMQWRAGA